VKLYVVAGQVLIGNFFGFFGHEVPEGRFAVVQDCEYANGGHGPASADGKHYPSEARALEVAAGLDVA
jgi:hypothetical protein